MFTGASAIFCGLGGGGGIVVLARGDGCDTLDALGFRGFFADDLAVAGGVGVARGVSCGDRRELISIVSCKENDQ